MSRCTRCGGRIIRDSIISTIGTVEDRDSCISCGRPPLSEADDARRATILSVIRERERSARRTDGAHGETVPRADQRTTGLINTPAALARQAGWSAAERGLPPEPPLALGESLVGFWHSGYAHRLKKGRA